MNRLLSSLVIIFALNLTSIALASDADDARQAADIIMTKMSQGDYKSVWDNDMSQLFRSKFTKDSFLANLTSGRSMLGAKVEGKLFEYTRTTGDSASGYQGDIYAFTYKNVYKGATVYEKVVVINENGDGFKLAGFFIRDSKTKNLEPAKR